MNLGSDKLLLSLATAMVLVQAAPAFAQGGQEGQQPAGSGNIDSANASAGDIIVTARRTEERLQDVPISMSVFSEENLSELNINTAVDLATFTPSLQSESRYGASNSTFSIRGFRQDLRTSSAVGVYFAEVVAPRGGNGAVAAGDGAGPGSFFDLENVQVLKGPQGTLFGRNTTGGAVLLVPRKPEDTLGGYVEGTLGNYDLRRLQGVINLPISDTVRVRLGGDWQERDGYVENISGIGPDRFGDIGYYSLRGSLVIDLTPDIENYTIASYSHSEDNGLSAKVTQATGNSDCSDVAFLSLFACQQFQRLQDHGDDFYRAQNSLENPFNRSTQWQVINTTTFKASDSLTIKNIASYSHFKSAVRFELFGADWILPESFPISAAAVGNPLFQSGSAGQYAGRHFGFVSAIAPRGRHSSDQKNFTEELQLQGVAAGGRLNWQAGAYMERSDPGRANSTSPPTFIICDDAEAFQCVDILGQMFSSTPVFQNAPGSRIALGALGLAESKVYFRNYGIYAQGTYALTDRLNVTAGLRHTWDKTRAVADQLRYRYIVPNNTSATPPFTVIPATPSCSLADTVLPNCTSDSSTKSKAPTWVLGLDYKPADDVMVYAKYSRGYRQGIVSFGAPVSLQTTRPEKVDAYEVGLKSEFGGSVRGTFNTALFYNELTDQQIQLGLTGLLGSGNTATLAVVNAGKSRIYGLEVDASISPVEGLTFSAAYAYLNAKLKAISIPADVQGYEINLSQSPVVGNRLLNIPPHKLVLGASYDLPVSEEVGDVSLSATWTYTSDYDTSTLVPIGTLPSKKLLNLGLSWDNVAQLPVDLLIFAKNVTKVKYYTAVFDSSSPNRGGFISHPLGEPRTFGVRLRHRFGG